MGLCPRWSAMERTRSTGGRLSLPSGSSLRAPGIPPGNFKGVVHVDGYPGFERLTDRGNIQLAACWAHARRKFYEVQEATGSPIAAEALRRIAELYIIEAAIRGQTADARQAARLARSLPLVAAMKTWLEAELHRIPPRGALAEAMRYALTRWNALCRFLDDGRIELDNKSSEQSGRSRLVVRTICSPDPPAVRTAGQPWRHCSPPQSSMTSSRSLTCATCWSGWQTAIPPVASTISCPGNGTASLQPPDPVSGMDGYRENASIEHSSMHDRRLGTLRLRVARQAGACGSGIRPAWQPQQCRVAREARGTKA
jgi:hypothetical protein